MAGHKEEFQFSNVIGIILTIFVAVIYYYCRYQLNYWSRRGVFQFPNSSLIFGDYKNGILFRSPPAYHLAELYHQAPQDLPYVGFYIFHKPCLLLKDPTLIKRILIRDFDIFCDRYFAGTQQMDSLGMINLFGMNNPLWRYVRNKTNPSFGRKTLKQLVPLMMESGAPMMEYLKNKHTDDQGVKVVDTRDLNYKYGSDLIGNLALGVQTNSFKNPNSDYTEYLMRFFKGFRRKLALVIVFFVPKFVKLLGKKILFDSLYLQKIFKSSIESRGRSSGTRGDFIDSLIKLKHEPPRPIWKFEGKHLFFQIGIFFSGLESSSIASIYTLVELAKNEGCQDRVRADVKKAINKHGWTFEAFEDMHYLDMCISETLRLYPPVVHLDRQPIENYKIPNSDLVIQKGTTVFMSIYGMNTDSKNFENPKAFIPERFIGAKKFSDSYLPFGGGPRMCIGMEMGRLHIKFVISKILAEYQVHRNAEERIHLDNQSTFTAPSSEIMVEFKALAQ